MKKTLLVTIEYPPIIGGVSHYYKNIVTRLPKESIAVLDNQHHALLSEKKIWPRWAKGIFSVYRYIKKEKIEHLLVGQILPIGTIAYILKKIIGTPYTVMTHAMDVTIPFAKNGSKRKQWLVKKILSHATAVTTVSQYTKNQLEHIGVQSKKIHIIYPCPHIEKNSSQEQEKDTKNAFDLNGKKIILTVARLVERKGIDMLIEALPLVLEKESSAVLVIVGEGHDRTRLEKIVTEKKMDHFVHFIGMSTQEKLATWYRHCTLFAMPSRQLDTKDVEGFGIVFLEAGLFEKPVIGGNSGGIPDAIEDGVTGFLVDPTNKKEIAEKIIFLLQNEKQASKMGKAGKERVEKYFQWEKQVKKIEQLLS